MAQYLLDVRNLRTSFNTSDGIVPAVDGVSMRIGYGETLGVAGESGCGKSVTALSIMRLVQCPPGDIRADDVLFEGKSLLGLTEEEMRKMRGSAMSMIFQEPMTSLDPVFTVGYQIAEGLMLHGGLSQRQAMERAIDMLRLVGIPMPELRVNEYPHQLSGGMRQRVMIGIALSCKPKLLIADEPTTALDVTIQAQILDLMERLKEELGMAIMIITHDLGVIAEMAERVVVMYAGQVVEGAGVVPLFARPLHPYTHGLLNSIPSAAVRRERLSAIKGVVPSPMFLPKGCRFNPRCPFATRTCRDEPPELRDVGGGHSVRCHYPLASGDRRGQAWPS